MGFFDIFRKHSISSSSALAGSVDRHCHIIPGVDDGIKSIEDSLEVIKFEESHGVTDIWCTSHIMEDCPNITEELKSRFEELKSLYKGGIELHLAAEYMLDTLFEDRLEKKDLLTMEHNTVLVETSTWTPPYNMDYLLDKLMKSGYRPLLAHPERYRYLDENQYKNLKQNGIRFQLNISSLISYYGETARKKALWLLKNNMYDAYGSDCHRLKSIINQYAREDLPSSVIPHLKRLTSLPF